MATLTEQGLEARRAAAREDCYHAARMSPRDGSGRRYSLVLWD